MPLLWPPGTDGARYQCKHCQRTYVYGDSLDRHMRDKHGTKFERAVWAQRLARERAERKHARRASKHRTLHYAVVKEALAWYRRVKVAYGKPMAVVDCRAFEAACAALEKFETEDTK